MNRSPLRCARLTPRINQPGLPRPFQLTRLVQFYAAIWHIFPPPLTLLGMPDAKGYFHKAIIQSGSQMEAHTRAEGAEAALILMAELGLQPNEIEKLFDVPPRELVEAQIRLAPKLWSRWEGAKRAEFEPIIDGKTLPIGCFDHATSPISRDVPLLVGTCATETSFFLSAVPGVFAMGGDQMQGMIRGMLGAESERILSAYETSRPDATPTEILLAITGDFLFRRKAIRLAELKVAQGRAPVYMYILGFETDVHDGKFKTPHILDLPLVFAHPDHPILGSNPARFLVSRQMSGAWANFARKSNPNIDLLPAWPAYDMQSRATMVFEEHPHVVLDPFPEERTVW